MSDRRQLKRRKREARKRQAQRNRLLIYMLLYGEDDLQPTVRLGNAAEELGWEPDYAATLARELGQESFVGLMGSGPSEDQKPCLTEAGKRQAESLLRPFYRVLWDEYRHSIVTGIFMLIASLFGAVGGSFLTYVLVGNQ